MKTASYQEVRNKMQPGDVIAFGGKSILDGLIKLGTRSDVSHVGVILQTEVPSDPDQRFINHIIESTFDLESQSGGVSISRA